MQVPASQHMEAWPEHAYNFRYEEEVRGTFWCVTVRQHAADSISNLQSLTAWRAATFPCHDSQGTRLTTPKHP